LFFLGYIKEMSTFIQQGRIKLIKSDSKDFYMVTKELFIHQIIVLQLPQKY